MRYIVCITIGLPGVGKTCLKFLLMGLPPPELRSSTICAETPIRINVRAISEIKLITSGEKWIEVNNDDMLNIVAQMIILVSEQDKVRSSEAKVTENPLLKIFRWIKGNRRSTCQPPDESHDDNLPIVKADPQQPSAHFEACQKAVKAIMEKLVQIITRLRNEKSETASSLSRKLLESIWVYLSDCVGQPQYHELLPLFIQHISAALCVLRLPDQLDKVQAVEYYSENQLLGVAQQSQLSAKDTIQCLVNTIQSFSTKGQKPKIILIGTHRDVLEEVDKQKGASSTHSDGESSPPQESSTEPTSSSLESLEEKNRQLLEMLEPEFADQLIYHSKDMKQLLFTLNTLNPEEIDKAKASVIRKAVENAPAQEVDVPIWWYIFERQLQKLARKLGRKVLSKAECLEIANALGFKERHLEAALRFFDELNVIKYSPKVLPNVVFAESQVSLDKVSELVRESYLLRGDPSVQEEQLTSDSTPTEGKWKHFRDHGVISPELMKKFPRHYVPEIFTVDDLSELLKELLVFAPIPTPEWEKPSQATVPSGTLPMGSFSPSQNSSPKQESGPHFVMPASLVTLNSVHHLL